MTTLHEARFRLDQIILERHASGLPTSIEQIDCVLCEDNESIMGYIYFVGASVDDVATVLFDLQGPPELFDRRACADALLRCNETVH